MERAISASCRVRINASVLTKSTFLYTTPLTVGVFGMVAFVAILLNKELPVLASLCAPNTVDDDMLTALSRCDRFGCHPDVLDCTLRFDVLAEVLELLQIGGGFE